MLNYCSVTPLLWLLQCLFLTHCDPKMQPGALNWKILMTTIHSLSWQELSLDGGPLFACCVCLLGMTLRKENGSGVSIASSLAAVKPPPPTFDWGG